MELDKIINDSLLIAEEIKNTKEYQELQKLKALIDTKYQKEIEDFDKAKEDLELLKDTKGSLLENAKKKFLETKEVLYSFSEVAQYKRLERQINEMLEEVMKEVKKVL